MNSLNISIKIDQKAALLAGKILNASEVVDVSPESIGDQWPALVALLDMSTTPPRAALTVPDATAEAIRAKLVEMAAEETKSQSAEAERKAITLAAATAEVEALEAAAAGPMESIQIPVKPDVSDYYRGSVAIGDQPAFAGVRRRLPHATVIQYYLGADAYAALLARRDAAEKASQAEVDAINDAAFAAALPELRERKAAMDAAATAKAEADAAAKKAANAIKFAEHLESGYWERETGSYNERRHSAWWCAAVDFSAGAKGDYTFGESTGSWGKAGMLRVACAPGDFIAYGQKDLRHPGNSDHTILRMRADGSMEDMGSKAEAYKAYRESKKAVAA